MWNANDKPGKVNCESSFLTLIQVSVLGQYIVLRWCLKKVTYLNFKLWGLHQKHHSTNALFKAQ